MSTIKLPSDLDLKKVTVKFAWLTYVLYDSNNISSTEEADIFNDEVENLQRLIENICMQKLDANSRAFMQKITPMQRIQYKEIKHVLGLIKNKKLVNMKSDEIFNRLIYLITLLFAIEIWMMSFSIDVQNSDNKLKNVNEFIAFLSNLKVNKKDGGSGSLIDILKSSAEQPTEWKWKIHMNLLPIEELLNMKDKDVNVSYTDEDNTNVVYMNSTETILKNSTLNPDCIPYFTSEFSFNGFSSELVEIFKYIIGDNIEFQKIVEKITQVISDVLPVAK